MLCEIMVFRHQAKHYISRTFATKKCYEFVEFCTKLYFMKTLYLARLCRVEVAPLTLTKRAFSISQIQGGVTPPGTLTA